MRISSVTGSRRVIPALFLAAMFASAAAGWSVYRSVQVYSTSVQWVRHTIEVQSKLNLLTAHFLESEVTWRDHLSSGDASSEEQAREKAAIYMDLQGLGGLISDNPEQRKNLNELTTLRWQRRRLLDDWLQRSTVAPIPLSRSAEAYREDISQLGRIREKLVKMQDEESLLLRRRQDAESAAFHRSSLTIVLTSGAALTLICAALAVALIESNRREAGERKSLRQAEHLQAILSGLGEGVMVADPDGNFTLFNGTARKILGMPEKEPGDSALWSINLEVFASDGITSLSPTEVPLALALRGQATDNVELQVRRPPSDSRVSVSVTGRPLEWEDERTGGVVVFRDVSESKRYQRELERQSASLEQANRKLEANNREIASFYHTLSHELKTPLTSAREFIAILQDGLAGALTDEQREYLSLARESCDQMTQHINDLLDMTRIETGKYDLQIVACEMAPVLKSAAASFQPSMEAKGIRLRVELAPQLPLVLMDARRLTQVLTNLLSNARKYAPPGGEVVVSADHCAPDRDFVSVSVANDGPLISPRHLERIFDRLYQVRKADATVEGGLGLGLYICKQIVLSHGGAIRAENVGDTGVRFTLTLRRAEPGQAETAAQQKNAPHDVAS